MNHVCQKITAALALTLTLSSNAWGQPPRPPATAPTTQSEIPVEMPIRGGEIVVKVPNGYDAARLQVLQAASAQGAELLDARTLVDIKGRKHGWLRLRLPAAHLPALLGAVQGVGRLYGENVTTTDHASEYEELARRIFRLRQHEVRLNGILESGRRLRGGDLLYVQERLFRASVDESLLAQRRADLERDTQLNTLKVQLFEPGSLALEPPRRLDLGMGYRQTLGLARASLDRQLAHVMGELVYGLVFAPLWLPLLLVTLSFLVWAWRRRRVIGAGLRRMTRRAFRLIRAYRAERI